MHMIARESPILARYTISYTISIMIAQLPDFLISPLVYDYECASAKNLESACMIALASAVFGSLGKLKSFTISWWS